MNSYYLRCEVDDDHCCYWTVTGLSSVTYDLYVTCCYFEYYKQKVLNLMLISFFLVQKSLLFPTLCSLSLSVNFLLFISPWIPVWQPEYIKLFSRNSLFLWHHHLACYVMMYSSILEMIHKNDFLNSPPPSPPISLQISLISNMDTLLINQGALAEEMVDYLNADLYDTGYRPNF